MENQLIISSFIVQGGIGGNPVFCVCIIWTLMGYAKDGVPDAFLLAIEVNSVGIFS